MQNTSIEIYRKLEATGFFRGIRLKVLEVLGLYGEMTQAEMAKFYLPDYQQRSITPRFKELLKMEVIRVTGERPCRVTGHAVKTWSLVEQIPLFLQKPKRPVSEKCRLLTRIKELEDLVETQRLALLNPSRAAQVLVATRYRPDNHPELFEANFIPKLL